VVSEQEVIETTKTWRRIHLHRGGREGGEEGSRERERVTAASAFTKEACRPRIRYLNNVS